MKKNFRFHRRSKPPINLASTVAPTTEYAPEGTLILVTDSLLPP